MEIDLYAVLLVAFGATLIGVTIVIAHREVLSEEKAAARYDAFERAEQAIEQAQEAAVRAWQEDEDAQGTPTQKVSPEDRAAQERVETEKAEQRQAARDTGARDQEKDVKEKASHEKDKEAVKEKKASFSYSRAALLLLVPRAREALEAPTTTTRSVSFL